MVDVEKLNTHRFPLEQALEAFKPGLDGKSGKILIYTDAAKIPKL